MKEDARTVYDYLKLLLLAGINVPVHIVAASERLIKESRKNDR